MSLSYFPMNWLSDTLNNKGARAKCLKWAYSALATSPHFLANLSRGTVIGHWAHDLVLRVGYLKPCRVDTIKIPTIDKFAIVVLIVYWHHQTVGVLVSCLSVYYTTRAVIWPSGLCSSWFGIKNNGHRPVGHISFVDFHTVHHNSPLLFYNII